MAWTLRGWQEALAAKGRFAEVIVCDEEFANIWDRVEPAARQSGYVLLNGMKIRPRERMGTLDVSDRPLIPLV